MSLRRIVECDSCDAQAYLRSAWTDELPKGWQEQRISDRYREFDAKHLCPDCVKTAQRYDQWRKERVGR